MKKIASALMLLLCAGALQAQEGNYVLVINGDSTEISLDKPSTLHTKNGKLELLLKQKALLTFTDKKFSFQHPSKYSFSREKLEEGMEQIIGVTGQGNSILIQTYTSVNPELLKELMLDEITKESKAAGYTEAKQDVEQKLGSGTVLKGTRSVLTLEEEQDTYTVYTMKQGKGGFLIVTMLTSPREDRDLFEKFWSTFRPL